MTSRNEELIRQRIRSPRSAAVAGIIFSVLMFAAMILSGRMLSDRAIDVNREWLEAWSGTATFSIGVVPFVGIAFLWFTGVIREHLGNREDRFFSTIFLGSSIVLVSMFFVWGATIGASFSIANSAAGTEVGNDIYVFGFSFMNQIIGNYALRMAGVYMFSIGTIWTRSGVMPRWMSILTFIVAVGFLFFASAIREARYIFPAWVFVVSAYILILNYRNTSGDGRQSATTQRL